MGFGVNETGADLGVVLAVASSVLNRPLADDMIVCGEVGLVGELRQPSQVDRRLEEAARIGYKRAIVPASIADTTANIKLLRAATVPQAMALSSLAGVHAVA